MVKRTLLIDADIFAFQASMSLEQAIEWAPGYWTWSVNVEEVKARVVDMVESAVDLLDADRAILCLTDPYHNFRLDVLPSYKGHRKSVKKPLALLPLKDWMVAELDAKMLPGLEGDDLLGILATTPSKDERIVVSLDKDLKTIPAPYVRTRAVSDDMGTTLVGAWDISQISKEEAEYNHLLQTLMGDTTDGYSGCPGVGKKRAEGILELGATIADNWKRVVETYASKGLGEEEALVQARVARILHADDYDLEKKEVILWEPK
jgi:DNA polymerase-1